MKKQSIHTVAPILAIALMTVSSCFKEDTGILITSYVRDQEMKLNPQRTYSTASVDLGLSVQWATCNLGTSSPEEYGGYYQWAGTKDVASMSIDLGADNCPYHRGSRYEYDTGWTKYIPADRSTYWSGSGSPDDKMVLDPEDDVAHVKLGGKWRMPTAEEWRELRENCTWTWTMQNGVNGYKVTGKKSGYTDKSIFLPVAGVRGGGRFLNYAGEDGFYWSSSLYTGFPHSASCFHFEKDNIIDFDNNSARSNGLSVRPVYGEVTDTPVPALPAGPLAGEFSVSATKKVHFSQGNLFWDGDSFEFEANQYDFQNSWSANHVSHFFWSKTASVAYAENYSDPGASTTDVFFSNETTETAKADFTVNGVTEKYRTLSKNEWAYLFNTSGRMVNGKPCYSNAVGGVSIEGVTYKGVFVYPDNYNGNIVSGSMSWNDINAAGIVFLPAAGCRYGSDVYNVGAAGYYWSSTAFDEDSAFFVFFTSLGVGPDDLCSRDSGFSVRLITESAEGYTSAVKVTGVSLNKSKTTIDVGDTETLVATVTPANAANKQLSWTSSDPAIATVDANGKVTGEAVGSAAITATTADGNFTAVCLVTVAPGAPDGALAGEFSVSATKKVHFSKGNLWYDGSKFKFEANQYDSTPSDNGSWNTSHVSHFFWSKDASAAYAENYSDSGDASDVFFTNATETTSKDGFTVNVGGTEQTGWRTLSTAEWQYLLNTRTMTYNKSRYSNAVSGVTIGSATYKGVFLYPDNYNGEVVSSGSMTWDQINAAGIVFLPAAGSRYGSDVFNVGGHGLYWSSTAYDGLSAYSVTFYSGYVRPDICGGRDVGYSVRLITESK